MSFYKELNKSLYDLKIAINELNDSSNFTNKIYISVAQASLISGICKTLIYEYIKTERFRSKKLGRKRMINKESFLDFLNE